MIATTVIGSLLGFAGSAIAPIVGLFQQKAAAKLEIEKMEQAAKLAQAGFKQEQIMYQLTSRDEEHQRLLDHDVAISKGTGFVAGLQKLVRPLITYAFFGLFATVKMSVLYVAMENGEQFSEAINYVWDETTQVIFATIICFWFGNRVYEKKNKQPH
jgi:hypothetical protein